MNHRNLENPEHIERQLARQELKKEVIEEYKQYLRGTGSGMIAEERARQMVVEGWTPAHDDNHRDQELAFAAKAYTEAAIAVERGAFGDYTVVPIEWPWATEWWKPTIDPIPNLVKAGALIAAEIDRLQRMK
jgi:hypothetical protein